MRLATYLAFNGQCEEAFKFYEKTLGGKIRIMMKNGESPMAAQTPADQRDRVMHVSLAIGGQDLMGADAPPEHYRKPQGFSAMIDVESPDEAERIFNALSEGGSVRMPIQETFWARRFGMLIDRFGTPWMVNCEKPM